jgi:hypothetical protein
MNEALQLTLFAEDSPVRTSPLREKARELKASVAGYGRNTPELLASYDPNSSLWRTSQHSLVEGLTVFSEAWPRSGTMRNGIAYQLQPLVRLTDATESGLWRTPDTGAGGTSGLLKKGQSVRANGQPIQIRLVDQVNNARLWPTPTLQDTPHKEMILTPNQRRLSKDGKSSHSLYLADKVGGQLNPTWVEWLMGFPIGWTDLNNSETP